MKKRIFTLCLAICLLLTASGVIPAVAAPTGNPVNMTFSAKDTNKDGLPNGMQSAGIPAAGTALSPYSYGVVGGVFGKDYADEVFSYRGEQNTPFEPVGGVPADQLRNACFNITTNLNGVDGEMIHFSFEMAREGYKYGGYVEMRPKHKDSGTSYPYFNPQAQLWNNTYGLTMFGQKIDNDGISLKNWNKFDYVFFTKYTPSGSSEVYTAVDAYYNGCKVIDKLKLDADMNLAGDQIMTGLNQIRFAYSLSKSYDGFPGSTTYIDNVKCDVVTEEPDIAKPELSHDSSALTFNNQRRTVSCTDETMTVASLLGGLPAAYDYSFADASGRKLGDTALLSTGNLLVKDKISGDVVAYYRLERPAFSEAAPAVNLGFSASDVNASTKIPNGMSGGSLPVTGTENSPYSYGIQSGAFGKAGADESLWFTGKWDSTTFVDAGGILAKDLPYGCFNISPNIKNIGADDVLHLSFEIARDGFARGLAAEMRPNHKDYSGGTMPYFSQGNFINFTSTKGISVFGQYIDAAGLSMQTWNKFDYLFFPQYAPTAGTAPYTAVDVYYNGFKVIDKLKLDADSKVEGDQIMNGLQNIRFMYSLVAENGKYPESTTILDNVKCGVVKRVPEITPVQISHPKLAIDNQRREITDSDIGISAQELLGGLSMAYTYEVVDKSGQAISGDTLAAPGYLRVKSGSDIVAIYKLNQTLSTSLASDVFTIVRDSINGYAGMTVDEVLAAATVNARSQKAMYCADGQPASGSDAAIKGMYLRVTAADGETYSDYVLNYEEQYAGEISYIVDGLNADGTFTNGKLTANVTIDGYKADVSKEYTLVAAQYQGGRLIDIKSEKKTVSGKTSETITLAYDVQNLPGTSMKLYLWDSFSGMQPMKESYLIDTRLAGKTMANFGDSITGMGMRSYVENIQKNTGITTINLGIGGAKMANKANIDIDVLSMAETIKAITTPGFDWSRQDAYAQSSGQAAIVEHVKNMKALDLTNTDYASIWFGTNDFTSNVVLDNAQNQYDVTTFGGALRYSLDKLLEANPDLKIMLITPMYRDRQIKQSDNPYIADGKNSDDYPNSAGVYLTEYGDKIKEIAAGYGPNVMVIDMYEKSGINRYNHQNYFYDGLHPQGNPESVGNRLLGSKFSDFIVRNF